MPEVFVGMGSNVEPEAHLRRALTALEQRFGPLRRSTAYRNPAVGFDGNDFINLVVAFETAAAVTDVALALSDIENDSGRDRSAPKFAPRSLDLDLLLYGDSVNPDGTPSLPREEILDRVFVLGPLAELAPDRVHPTEGRTYAELWADFPGDKTVLVPVRL